jgi:hypothetical protein
MSPRKQKSRKFRTLLNNARTLTNSDPQRAMDLCLQALNINPNNSKVAELIEKINMQTS